MCIEEYGRFYIQEQTIAHKGGSVHAFFEVGDIVNVDGVKRYKVSNDQSFKSREEALQWIEQQGD
ncbi:hypothetical protein C8J36_101276 [Rhizobium sp. PP-F2F-G48]|uniref:hypothetical protein n=1 Tax=Rhizobium sp. PP-F2F-G48 TaxID=2135651 RepID=UPI00104521CA|nr:hypothetical protein [Rhizobium sp. PP-F2F-G48]TCM58376.1 hypothetical protein C8J36_101276 [Rhizobium sp. PP-F2F-G48]